MKNRGLRVKRATDALKRICENSHGKYRPGSIVHTSKKHYRYFDAIIINTETGDEFLASCAYISSYNTYDDISDTDIEKEIMLQMEAEALEEMLEKDEYCDEY